MDMFNAYVGVQGFNLTNGFIVKEITVLYPNQSEETCIIF